jgi:diguanylate cyclase (GGDEF)-like protein
MSIQTHAVHHTRAALDADGALGIITVLAVDDDPVVLDALTAVLDRPALRLVTLDEPARFWEVLDETAPDLLMLDVDMPGIDGFALCRSVRASATWAGLPVLILTRRTDPETVHAVFAVGADDYVRKPIQGLELRTRIENRIERVELYRRLAEEDHLTGLLTRRRGEDLMARLVRLGGRTAKTVGLAVLDVDCFKEINDRHGHAAGDDVLRQLGAALLDAFRGDDVVARWGGEEFALALYDASRAVAAERLREVLEAFSQRRFTGPDGEEFQVTFSGGVAQYPEDGDNVDRLHAAADAAMYRAKDAGRAQVMSC